MPLLFLEMFDALGHGSRVLDDNGFQVIFHNDSHAKLVSLLPHLLHSKFKEGHGSAVHGQPVHVKQRMKWCSCCDAQK